MNLIRGLMKVASVNCTIGVGNGWLKYSRAMYCNSQTREAV